MVIWLLTVILISHPAIGANFGGTLTALAAFGIAGLLWAGGRLRAGTVAWMLFGLALCGVGLFLLDVSRPEPFRTHVGQLAAVVVERGPSEGLAVVWRVARRKLGMNLRLLTSGFFIAVLAGVAPALALWYHKTGRGLRPLLAARPSLRAGVCGALGGALVGLFVKDSGVVVWGLVTAAALAALLDVMLEARYADHGSGRGR
jgi:hypothetical protein